MNDPRRTAELLIGRVLQAGVTLAALVMLAGGLLYLSHTAGVRPSNYSRFAGEPAQLTTPGGIVAGALSGDSLGVMMLGLLLLIATPVLRVLLSVGIFLMERDWIFVAITLFVLAVLLYSLVGR